MMRYSDGFVKSKRNCCQTFFLISNAGRNGTHGQDASLPDVPLRAGMTDWACAPAATPLVTAAVSTEDGARPRRNLRRFSGFVDFGSCFSVLLSS